MKNYIIVYGNNGTKYVYYTCGETQVDVVLNMFEYCGGSMEWTAEELKVIGQHIGVEKLVSLFQKEHYEIELIAEYLPIIDNRKFVC